VVKSGENDFYLFRIKMNTTTFIGEFECRLDIKGRLSIPSGLYKQFAAAEKEKFVIHRSIFQKCLNLYPMSAWETIMTDIKKLNRFIKENDMFVRHFQNGATEVEVDSANRILIPKRLSEYAGLEKDIVLTSSFDKIEIWSDTNYRSVMDAFDQSSFEALAEKVMSKIGEAK
jgi:MraZ protein